MVNEPLWKRRLKGDTESVKFQATLEFPDVHDLSDLVDRLQSHEQFVAGQRCIIRILDKGIRNPVDVGPNDITRSALRNAGFPLPVFKGYTVDYRLKEFRKAEYGKDLEIIPFDSAKGRKLLRETGRQLA